MLIMVKRSDRIRIKSNWTLLIIILILIMFLIILIYFIAREDSQNNNNNNSECNSDKDCSPVCGCHPNSCIPALAASLKECKKMICTQECSGPLDCNAGYCGCVNGKCSVVNNK